MGFARRVVRKSVHRATPRPVRKAMHPARTARNAITPRPVKQVSRAAYTVRHPVGAAENAAMGAVLYPQRPRNRGRTRRRGSQHAGFGCLGIIVGIILLAVAPWWLPALIIVAAIVVPIMAWQRVKRQPRPMAPPPASFPWTPPPGGPQPSAPSLPKPPPMPPPASAGDWEYQARRQTGLGDGSYGLPES
jgi:hypothetical protein